MRVCGHTHSALPPAMSLQPAVGRPEKGCEGGPVGEGPCGCSTLYSVPVLARCVKDATGYEANGKTLEPAKCFNRREAFCSLSLGKFLFPPSASSLICEMGLSPLIPDTVVGI